MTWPIYRDRTNQHASVSGGAPTMGDAETCGVCAAAVVGPAVDTLTAGCCARRFHDLCIARHCASRRDEVRREGARCRFSRDVGVHVVVDEFGTSRFNVNSFIPRLSSLTPQVPCPACDSPLRKLVADAVDHASPARVPRRVRRGRQDWHLLVDATQHLATALRCSVLFSIPKERVRLLANGRVLNSEREVEAAVRNGAAVMVLGSNKRFVVATTSVAETGTLFVKCLARRAGVGRTFWLITRTFGSLTRTAQTAGHALTSSPLWWLFLTLLKSISPAWENPYQAGFDERLRSRRLRGDNDDRRRRAPRPPNDQRPRHPPPPDGNVRPHRLG